MSAFVWHRALPWWFRVQITSAAIIMKAFAMLSISNTQLFDCVMDRVLHMLETIAPQVASDSHMMLVTVLRVPLACLLRTKVCSSRMWALSAKMAAAKVDQQPRHAI